MPDLVRRDPNEYVLNPGSERPGSEVSPYKKYRVGLFRVNSLSYELCQGTHCAIFLSLHETVCKTRSFAYLSPVPRHSLSEPQHQTLALDRGNITSSDLV